MRTITKFTYYRYEYFRRISDTDLYSGVACKYGNYDVRVEKKSTTHLH